MIDSANCANCGAALAGAYCAECGQKYADLDRSVPALLYEAWDELAGVEGRLAKTLRLLVRYPGRLTMEYVAGRRVSYTSPIRLYLIASAVYFVVFRLTRPVDQSYYGYEGTTTSSYYDTLSLTLILLLPAITLVLWLTHLRTRRTLIQHIVFSLHIGAAGLLGTLVLTLIAFGCKILWQHHTRAPAWLPEFVFWLFGPGLVLFTAYIVVALRRAYNAGLAASVIRGILVVVSAIAALFLLAPVIGHLQ